jgi:hypothetical protein
LCLISSMHEVCCNCRKIPNGVNGIEERLHVVWQEMVVPGRLLRGRSQQRDAVRTAGHLSAMQTAGLARNFKALLNR